MPGVGGVLGDAVLELVPDQERAEAAFRGDGEAVPAQDLDPALVGDLLLDRRGAEGRKSSSGEQASGSPLALVRSVRLKKS